MMSKTYIVQLSHAASGYLLQGLLEAESASDAQRRLLELLKEHDVPEEHITYNVSHDFTITLTGGFTLTINRPLTVERWMHIVPQLVVSQRSH